MTRTPTDTLIGIAGFVAILMTLIGVFAFEYNNANGDDTDPDGNTTMPPEDPLMSESFEGSLGGTGASSSSHMFTPDEGVTGFVLDLTWTSTAPIPGAFTLSYELTDANGMVIASGSATNSVSLTVPQPKAESYTLNLSVANQLAAGSYTADASYDY